MLIDECDTEACVVVDRLLQGNLQQARHQQLLTIKEALEGYDFDRALELLEEMEQ